MTVGISITSANAMLDSLGDVYVQMHIGDPGEDGTSNVSEFTDRELADLGAAAAGVRTLEAPVEWAGGAAWTGVAQTVTHVSCWSADTGGSFVFSAALASQIDFTPGFRPRLSSLSVSIPSTAGD